MAKYYITYKCGHEATVQINGTNVHGERERKAAWYGTIDCPECKAANTAKTNKNAGMADLDGSPKQVAWAESIRGELLPELDQERQGCAEHGATAEQLAQIDTVLAWLRDQQSAAWWIDHRLSSHAALRAAGQAVRSQQ
ncbi:MAG: hypothetical protein [Bacteriophage sp.]|nr:MAG: hypothetical protein [Bacteriophage sp.]